MSYLKPQMWCLSLRIIHQEGECAYLAFLEMVLAIETWHNSGEMANLDYVPWPEGEFDEFQGSFVDYAVANLAGVLTPSLLAELTAGKAEWVAAYPAHIKAKTAAREAAELKRASRKRLVRAIREAAGALQANPNVGDDVLISMRLTVRDRVRTPAPVPDTEPLLNAHIAGAQTVILRFFDGEGKTRRKPKGVVGCQIFVDVGAAAPSDREAFRYLGMSSDGRFQVTFLGEEIGKYAHFYGRWMNTRGELGPYGPTLTVVVPN